MKCPVCQDADLLMTDRQGIEIDYCPRCRGVWLDRGELDRLIERAAGQIPAPRGAPAHSEPRHPERPRQPHHGDYEHRRRKSFLGELFDFD